MAKETKKSTETIVEKVIEREPAINYTGILNKIFISLAVIIALLCVNTVLLALSVGEFSTDEPETTTNAEYDVSMFTEITANEYAEIYKKDELVVTYFGRATCGYCVQFLPVLQQAQNEFGYQTQYVDIDVITQDDANIIFALDEQFNDTLGRTPMVTITKGGKLVNIQMGYTDYDTFAKFLTDNGVTKK